MDGIEKSFDERRAVRWIQSRWHWSLCIAALYLLLIYLGRKYVMKNREPYNLRTALCMWNTGLCVFSMYTLYRAIQSVWITIYLGGIQHLTCDLTIFVGSSGGGLWMFIFTLSKFVELFDTLFIILRKQKLIFLHYYHHATIFAHSWLMYSQQSSSFVWPAVINAAVHSAMYLYYAVKASGRTPPKWVPRVLTSIQLVQMYIGIYLCYKVFVALKMNKTCGVLPMQLAMGTLLYVSYIILFINFFYRAYIIQKKRSSDRK